MPICLKISCLLGHPWHLMQTCSSYFTLNHFDTRQYPEVYITVDTVEHQLGFHIISYVLNSVSILFVRLGELHAFLTVVEWGIKTVGTK